MRLGDVLSYPLIKLHQSRRKYPWIQSVFGVLNQQQGEFTTGSITVAEQVIAGAEITPGDEDVLRVRQLNRLKNGPQFPGSQGVFAKLKIFDGTLQDVLWALGGPLWRGWLPSPGFPRRPKRRKRRSRIPMGKPH